MTKMIWKYELPKEVEFAIEIPKYAKILSLQLQNNKPCIWVMFDKETEIKEKREFCIVGTGIEFDDKLLQHIGIYQQGLYVFHLFEKVSIGAKVAELL